MPRKPVPKPPPREEQLSLNCEWDQCQEVYSQVSAFIQHIGTHLKEILAQFRGSDGQPLEIGSDLPCEWRDCDTTTMRDFPALLRHVYFHAFHVKLKCRGMNLIVSDNLQQCNMESSSRNMIPELPERLRCSWQSCEEIHDSPQHFYDHVQTHTESYPNGNNVPGGCKCKWSDCDTVVRSRHKLREHLRSHTQEKLVACPTCGALFSNNTKFKDHTKQRLQAEESSHVRVVQMFQCSHCNKRFAAERLLRDHMRHHAKETFKCSYCNKSIVGGKRFRSHVKNHVNHYKCPLCDMTCSTPSSLRIHVMYRHTESKPFKCQECDYSTKTATCLRRHMERHTNGKYTCCASGCSFQAKTYSSLWYHYRRIHQDHQQARYLCHLCERKFTRGRRLTLHLKQTHRFKWPSGHKRFRYKLHDDGLYRLQTVRYESIELTEQILAHKVGSSTAVAPSAGQEREAANSSSSAEPTNEHDMLPPVDKADDKDKPDMSDLSYNLEMLGDVALQLPLGNATSTPISKEHLQAREAFQHGMNDSAIWDEIEEEYDSEFESDVDELEDEVNSILDSPTSRNKVLRRKRKRDEGEVVMGSGPSRCVIGKRLRGVDEAHDNIVNILPQPLSTDGHLLPGTIHIPSPIHVSSSFSPEKSAAGVDHGQGNQTPPAYASLTTVELPQMDNAGSKTEDASEKGVLQHVFTLNMQQLQESPILSMPTDLVLPNTPGKRTKSDVNSSNLHTL